MLNLKLETDKKWADLATRNLDEIMTDHAYCEQKAASAAISFIVMYPEYPNLIDAMAALCREEMEHFQRVIAMMQSRGYKLGFDQKDDYVHKLRKFFKGGNRQETLINKLLMAAMIEARSCERFKVLSDNLKERDPELSEFYYELMVSEASHYTMFLKFAKEYGAKIDVDEIWKNFLKYEATVIKNYGNSEKIHG